MLALPVAWFDKLRPHIEERFARIGAGGKKGRNKARPRRSGKTIQPDYQITHLILSPGTAGEGAPMIG
jgi:hypothetical protein